MSKAYYVYILESKYGRSPYICITGNIINRMFQHKNHLINGYTDKCNATKLIYLEEFVDSKEAIKREKQLKGWTRSKKYGLVDKVNPDRKDLSESWGISILSPTERRLWVENYRKLNEEKKKNNNKY
ncbi:GIY-YIG nuclease family protein [Anaerococcus sp. DFU013_CI05]|uniref:GIY-YIG nuclease family protein n=1 Tax=Anaerococcus sp. AH8042_DFU013_CI05 TaxID=3385202 RepID=UPI003A52166A